MSKRIRSLYRDESGQDLIEYSLLIAFLALGAVGFFLGVGSSINGVIDEGSEVVRAANRSLQGN